MAQHLGPVIRELRLKANFTLRGFAKQIDVSAAHQSDIEKGRRMPGDEVLRRTVAALRHVGASEEYFQRLDGRLDSDVQAMIQATPEVGQLLREVHESGRSPRDVIRDLQRMLAAQRKDDQGADQE